MPARELLVLGLATLGVVYGGVETSPLYTLRECFFGAHSVAPPSPNVLGVLSLWGRGILILLGLFGTALLYSEGMITPPISVLCAVEGLPICSPMPLSMVYAKRPSRTLLVPATVEAS